MIAEKSQKQHPFKDGKAGHAWFEGFLQRHPKLTIRSPQSLSYSRAICANREAVDEFFGKLGSVYGRLSTPMLIFNCDETGVSIVHKPGKLIAELGRRNVYAVTCTERRKTELYIDWFKFFLQQIPPVCYVLLLQDGHSSHASIELIELAKANNIHLLCLLSHTTHTLQPLDVGV